MSVSRFRHPQSSRQDAKGHGPLGTRFRTASHPSDTCDAVALPEGYNTKARPVAMKMMTKIPYQLLTQPVYRFHPNSLVAGYGDRETGAYVKKALRSLVFVARTTPQRLPSLVSPLQLRW